jgi:catechol 2,3-dioxygenase-like lactoylglutathione lyase family enzyme
MIHGARLDHIAIAAARVDDVLPRYMGELGAGWVGGGPDVGFWFTQVRFANQMRLEILAPYEPEKFDFLQRFVERNGPGPHHITFKVKDLRAAIAEVEAAGYRPVNVHFTDPDWFEAFIHPKDGPGIVVQLAQTPRGAPETPAPEGLPRPAPATPARLDRLVHAVASLDAPLALFRDVLGGTEAGRGSDEAGSWVDLTWEGSPGAIRLLAPSGPSSPLAAWLGDRPGRLHHLALALDDPSILSGAIALSDGAVEVPPEANHGVRLVVSPSRP